MWNWGQKLNFRDFRFCRCLPLANNHDKVNDWEVICLPLTWWEILTKKVRRTRKVSTFSLWHISEAVQCVWIKRLDAAERAITQDEGLRAAEGLRRGHLCSTFFFSGYTVNSNRLETHRSSSGEQKRWLTLVSSHSGTGQICPLGVERPSNITQPFDLSTPTRPFPAMMDGFLCSVKVSWFIVSCKYLLFSPSPLTLTFIPHFWLNLYFPALSAQMVLLSYQLASCQKRWIHLLYEMGVTIMTKVIPRSDIAALG